MYKYEITKRIEEFAPLETQEEWDCSGWIVNVEDYNEIKKVMLCLTVTYDIVKQAKVQNCDMIISHHPCFYVPLEWSGVNIYSAHTNLDKAQGGTTDVLASIFSEKVHIYDFIRIIEKTITIKDFSNIIKTISPNARIVNNYAVTELHKIAFCAGSGADLIKEAETLGADCLVTGDIKFHTALESSIVLYDIGHFESEILVLPVFERLIGSDIEIVYAKEESPFKQI